MELAERLAEVLNQFEYSYLLTPDARDTARELFTPEKLMQLKALYGKKYYLSLDVEALGPDRRRHSTNSVGAYFGTEDGSNPHIILKHKWNILPFEKQSASFETLRWWSQHRDTFNSLQVGMIDPYAAAREIHGLILLLAVVTGPKNTTLLSDCQDFDFGRIDDLMERADVTTLPLRFAGFATQDMRHWSADPYAQSELLGKHYYPEFLKWLEARGIAVSHTHSPDDDAEMTYWQMIHVNLVKAKIAALTTEQAHALFFEF